MCTTKQFFSGPEHHSEGWVCSQSKASFAYSVNTILPDTPYCTTFVFSQCELNYWCSATVCECSTNNGEGPHLVWLVVHTTHTQQFHILPQIPGTDTIHPWYSALNDKSVELIMPAVKQFTICYFSSCLHLNCCKAISCWYLTYALIFVPYLNANSAFCISLWGLIDTEQEWHICIFHCFVCY